MYYATEALDKLVERYGEFFLYHKATEGGMVYFFRPKPTKLMEYKAISSRVIECFITEDGRRKRTYYTSTSVAALKKMVVELLH